MGRARLRLVMQGGLRASILALARVIEARYSGIIRINIKDGHLFISSAHMVYDLMGLLKRVKEAVGK